MTSDPEIESAETPALMEPTTVVRRKPPPLVEWVEIEGEVVAWSEETQDLHLLDPIASLIFQLCDGTATLEVNTADLAQAFGQPVEVVAGDVGSCLANLQTLGLVEVVR